MIANLRSRVDVRCIQVQRVQGEDVAGLFRKQASAAIERLGEEKRDTEFVAACVRVAEAIDAAALPPPPEKWVWPADAPAAGAKDRCAECADSLRGELVVLPCSHAVCLGCHNKRFAMSGEDVEHVFAARSDDVVIDVIDTRDVEDPFAARGDDVAVGTNVTLAAEILKSLADDGKELSCYVSSDAIPMKFIASFNELTYVQSDTVDLVACWNCIWNDDQRDLAAALNKDYYTLTYHHANGKTYAGVGKY